MDFASTSSTYGWELNNLLFSHTSVSCFVCPMDLIRNETLEQTRKRLLQTPLRRAWEKVGVKKHQGICTAVFSLKTPESSGNGMSARHFLFLLASSSRWFRGVLRSPALAQLVQGQRL